MFDAKRIFDSNLTHFSNLAGTPKSAEVFQDEYILPAYKRRTGEGTALDEAYGEAIADFQRDGFVVGFNTAVQLLMGCMSSEGENRPEP